MFGRASAIRSLALALALLAAGNAAADTPAASPVFVPSLWDPASPPAKPDPAALKPLLIVTGRDDPPFSFTLADGTPAGFDVDLARALCDRLHVSCTLQARRWDTIVPAIRAGAGDAAVASLSITDAAMRTVDFTSPYYRTPARFVATRATAPGDVSPASLAGKRVGVVSGSAHEAYLRAFFPAATPVPVPDAGALRAALAAGQVEIAFGDGIGFAGWLNGAAGNACCTFVGGPYTESRFFGEGAGIAVEKGRDDLRRALDYALWQAAQDGTYADLWLKYFPVSPY